MPLLYMSTYSQKYTGEGWRDPKANTGDLITKLHAVTKRFLVQAELMSTASVRHIDPSAAPLRWVLAIESEFHHKLYEGNRHRLERILGEKPAKPGKSCSIGQIHVLVKKIGGDRLKRPQIEAAIPAWRRLLAVRDVIAILELAQQHRNQIAHVTKLGPYTQVRCDEFLKNV